MTQSELRIELLKITYSHGREASEAVTRAKELEAYLLEAEEPLPVGQTDKTLKLPPKHMRER